MAETTQQYKFNLLQFIEKHFLGILLFVVFIIWYTGGNRSGKGITTSDTTYVIHVGESGPYTPPIINVLPPKSNVINLPEYQADTSSIQALRAQFIALVNKHTEQKTYNDSLKVDTLGYVNVKDTVSENKLTGRSFSFNIKERVINNTKYAPIKNQWFIGASVRSPIQTPGAEAINLGIIIKNKREDIISLSGGYNLQTKLPEAQLGYYKKLSFKSPIPKLPL